MKRWNIRIRLTLLFCVIQLVFVSFFSASVYSLFSEELMDAVDRNLRDKAEALGAAYEWEDENIEVELDEHSKDTLWANSLVQIRTSQGDVLFQNSEGPATGFPASATGRSAGAVAPQLFTAHLPGFGESRCVWMSDSRYGRPVIIAIGSPLKRMRAEQAELLRIMILAGMGLMAISLFVGWIVIGRLLRPLAAMSQRVRHITADRLEERLGVYNPYDEIGQLATTLNEMIERLQASFKQMCQFTTDASHELRTPLTSIRSEAEVALQKPRSADEYKEVIGSILEEIDRLTRMSDALLTLARFDSDHLRLAPETIDFSALVDEAIERIRVQAEAKGVDIQVFHDSGQCIVSGDRGLLEQILLNLLDNAIKYGGNEIRTGTRIKDGKVSLTVYDSGPGILEEHLEHLFDRFYRVEKSRSRELGGVGLGLSLARRFMELHGGEITVHSVVGKGTTFEVILPAPAMENESESTDVLRASRSSENQRTQGETK